MKKVLQVVTNLFAGLAELSILAVGEKQLKADLITGNKTEYLD